MSKLFNLLCLIAVTFGVVVLVQGNGQLTKLREEYLRLDQNFGSLNPTDPKKTLVKCIANQAPDFFRWRVYFPPESANRRIVETSTIGSLATSSFELDPQGTEVSFTLRHRDFDGEARLYFTDDSGSSVITFNSRLRAFVARHWAKLELKALAQDGPIELEPDQELVLFEIRVPQDLLVELPEATRQIVENSADRVLKISVVGAKP